MKNINDIIYYKYHTVRPKDWCFPDRLWHNHLANMHHHLPLRKNVRLWCRENMRSVEQMLLEVSNVVRR